MEPMCLYNGISICNLLINNLNGGKRLHDLLAHDMIQNDCKNVDTQLFSIIHDKLDRN